MASIHTSYSFRRISTSPNFVKNTCRRFVIVRSDNFQRRPASSSCWRTLPACFPSHPFSRRSSSRPLLLTHCGFGHYHQNQNRRYFSKNKSTLEPSIVILETTDPDATSTKPTTAPSATGVPSSSFSTPLQELIKEENDGQTKGKTAWNHRPMTLMERVKYFPKGVELLWNDYLNYRNIRDESQSRNRNAWWTERTIEGTELSTTDRVWMITHGTTTGDSTNQEKPKMIQLISYNNKSNKNDQDNNTSSSVRFYPLQHHPKVVYQNKNNRSKERATAGPVTTMIRIPRRQRHQQHLLVSAVGTVAPLVLMWMFPVVGTAIMMIGVSAPRQTLSRHFYNPYEVYTYTVMAFQQRHHQYATIQDFFWSMTMTKSTKLPLATAEERLLDRDAAGPLLDAWPYFTLFCSSNNTSQGGLFSSVDKLPREYLIHFALAAGAHQTFPLVLGTLFANVSPSWWLRHQVRSVAVTIAEDDQALLHEGAVTTECTLLTDVEVMDACLMRGLPISGDGITIAEMRQCLTNHLRMMASVQGQPAEAGTTNATITAEGWGLMALHLSIIRDYFNRQQSQSNYSKRKT